MNSKEALEILFSSYNFDGNYHDLIIAREKLEQSLDRLEQLEKALNILKENLFIEFKQNGVYLMVILKEDKEQECDYTIMHLDNKEEYELLKEALGYEN